MGCLSIFKYCVHITYYCHNVIICYRYIFSQHSAETSPPHENFKLSGSLPLQVPASTLGGLQSLQPQMTSEEPKLSTIKTSPDAKVLTKTGLLPVPPSAALFLHLSSACQRTLDPCDGATNPCKEAH